MPIPQILNVPPREAIRFFKSKDYEITFSWQDADAALHARAFTVAKAMEVDVLDNIKGAVERALAEGTTFAAFQEELELFLVRRGWWGRMPVLDPVTGEVRMVQLGSKHRLRTIFDVNLNTSYAAGRWERIEELKERLPYLRYVAVLDDRTRDEHRAWHGTVLPVDHPFWETHYPPNGWRCRCIVQQLGEDDLERYGYEVTKPPGDARRTRQWVNKRAGEVRQVPVGIDPGWDHNVGLVRRTGLAREALEQTIGKLDATTEAYARSSIQGFVGNPGFEDFLEGRVEGSGPVAAVPEGTLSAIGGRSRTLRLSSETVGSHPRFAKFGTEDWLRVQRILDGGRVFLSDRSRRVAIGFIEEDGRVWRAVLKRTKDGEETYLETLHRAKGRDLRSAIRRFREIGER